VREAAEEQRVWGEAGGGPLELPWLNVWLGAVFTVGAQEVVGRKQQTAVYMQEGAFWPWIAGALVESRKEGRKIGFGGGDERGVQETSGR
jgi:hypothetical protein